MTDEEVRTRILKRFEAMRLRPLMYAQTIEGFLMQIWLLLDFLGVDSDTSREWARKLYGYGSIMRNMDKPLTKEEADRMTESAAKLIGV